MPHISINDELLRFLLFLPFFFISLAVHEFSHAFFAARFGDFTAKNQGRLTLNPIKHIDVIGSLVMPLLSFTTGFFIGWAKPVPVNRNNFRNPLKDDITVSAAGPISNFFLSMLFFALFVAAVKLFPAADSRGFNLITDVLRLSSYFNVFLFLFNLLPIPPLDGSHILYDLFPNKITAAIVSSGLYGFLFLMLFIYSPLWGYFVKLVNFIFAIFIFIARML